VSERILFDSAEYYHTNLLESKEKNFEKEGVAYTGLEYQRAVRNHKVTQLVDFKIGLSDGKLHSYLLAIGFTEPEILDAGVVTRYEGGKLQDFFSANLFIYPMIKDGVVCSFTQKDPKGALKYQFSSKYRLNDILFFNQDAVKKAEKIYIVEGQNDVLSMYDDGLKPNEGVIGTCGSISQDQLKWLEYNLRKKKITTIFDRDEAGNIYRNKIAKILPQAIHIKFPDDSKWKDIDDMIKDGLHIQDAFKYVQEVVKEAPASIAKAGDIEEAGSVKVPSYDPQLNILEKDGCYFKVKVTKEDGEQLIPLSDFTIKLKNVFVIEGRRIREVQIVRADRATSSPILMDSSTKVSVANFKAKVADAIDANFYGREDDLTQIWRYVYKKGSERMVYLPDHIGRIENDGGWLFRNCYIRPDGSGTVTPDSSGVMWISGNTRGIRPQSISSSLEQDIYSNRLKDIPVMRQDISEEELVAMKESFVKLYAQNLGDVGKALLLVGWGMMNAFSD
ncbi:MAG TPA: toprim domain-containing protein, partial [Methanosarcina sp.]|nr:toprim domain-containing protein [Methanosarcina sp.]